MKNKYIVRSRISEAKFREILRLFCLDIEAKKVSEITNTSRPTINKIFDKIREDCRGQTPEVLDAVDVVPSVGELVLAVPYAVVLFVAEVRESVVGLETVCVNRRLPVRLLLYDRHYHGHRAVFDNLGVDLALAFQHTEDRYLSPGSPAALPTHPACAEVALVELYLSFAEQTVLLAGKVRLSRFRGIHKHKFYYHLKECEFRYNNRDKNVYLYLCKLIRNRPLKLS